jgi:hypothetical protein
MRRRARGRYILTGAYESAKDSRDDKTASADLGRKRSSVKTTLTIDQI